MEISWAEFVDTLLWQFVDLVRLKAASQHTNWTELQSDLSESMPLKCITCLNGYNLSGPV